MTTISLRALHKHDPPIDFTPPSGHVIHVVDNLTCVVIEAGMASGDPSVMILGVSHKGHGVAIETSLDKFLSAGVGLRALAEGQFGWVLPEGHASIVPGGGFDEGRFHLDAAGGLGEPCYSKTLCTERHVHAIWREVSP
jgi:hypothetical protein